VGRRPLGPAALTLNALTPYDCSVSAADLVDEIAVELRTWPGIRIERDDDGVLLVHHHHDQLGTLDPEHGVAEFDVETAEHNELVERGEAEPGDPVLDPHGVTHDIHGPADVTAVLELFDRRYREVRGEDPPYTSADPA